MSCVPSTFPLRRLRLLQSSMTYLSSLFYQLLDRDSIYDSLFDHSTPATIICTARTCQRAYRAAADYNLRAFDIHKHLQRFFTDPLEFRMVQAQTGTIISGSNALQFLDRDFYPESDLDLFVEPDHASAVCKWIVRRAGYDYRFEPNKTQKGAGIVTYEQAIRYELPWYFRDHMTGKGLAVASFSSMSESNGPGGVRKIQVVSRSGPPIATILAFHSSEKPP